MLWNFECPLCGKWCNVDWEGRDGTYTCRHCDKGRVPPGPADQTDAWVDTRTWPVEMESVVVSMKGNLCTAPDCTERYETLDHRLPVAKGGRTSVRNLFPMCNAHNQSKGDSDYDDWALRVKFGFA
jgi:hypothetical protein